MKITIATATIILGMVSTSTYGQVPHSPIILSPVNNARVTTNQITIAGRTIPDSGVTSVQYTLDGNGPFTAVQLNASNWNNWNAPVTLAAGSNQFVVWANGAGGSSRSNMANYFLVTTSPITININGLGSVLPNPNGKNLVVDKDYTVVAIPQKGQAFAGWSGGVTSSDARLTFLMEPNLELTASFVPNPFDTNGLPGPYAGLFWETGTPSESNAGLLAFTMDGSGHFTGQISVDGGLFTFGSRFDAAGVAQFSLHRHHKGDLKLMLTLDLSGVNGVTGTVSSDGKDGTGAFSSAVQAYHTFKNMDHAGKAFEGNYTLAVSGSGGGDASFAPQGSSFGTASINPAGLVNLSLSLSDGSSAIASGHIIQNGFLPFYVSLNGGTGSMLGWIVFTNGNASTNYNVFWFKGPHTKGSFTNGFSLTSLTMWIDPFKAPAHGENVLGASNVLAQLSGGDLVSALTDPVTLSAGGVGSGTNTDDVKLSVDNNTGLFKGSFVDPVSRDKTAIRGAVLESMQEGLGFYLTPDLLSGGVEVTPGP